MFRTILLAVWAAAVCAQTNPLAGVFSRDKVQTSTIQVTAGTGEETLRLSFPASADRLTLVVPLPEAARDWRKYESFSFLMQSNSSIGFTIAIVNGKGERFTYRVMPMPGLPVEVVIPGRSLRSEYMNNKGARGYAISNWGNHIDLSDVRALEIAARPNRPMDVELGRFRLSTEERPDRVLLANPVVDRFGQWKKAGWKGKFASLNELQAAWKAEQVRGEFPENWSRYGGWLQLRFEPSGFFRVQQHQDGRWWFVDPEGYAFFSTGMDCVRPTSETPVEGREFLFEALPAGSGRTADFYRSNVMLRFGAQEWQSLWKQWQEKRLRSWGFNTIANWSDPLMFRPAALPYVTSIRASVGARNWVGFPDVFAPEYRAAVEREIAAQVTASKDDKFLIGYFVGNEPRWHERRLVERIRDDAEPSATRDHVRAWLAREGDTAANRERLLEELARAYYGSLRDAIRKEDKNHMVLGIRYAGSVPDPVLRANDVFDIFSINIYAFAPSREQIDRITARLKKPVLIGEFHFGAPERGLAPSLVAVRDQQQRGVAYQYYVEQAAAHPAVIGTHYFQWIDQPPTGRFDGENYNLGFVSLQDIPYAELVTSAVATHQRVYQVHSGAAPPSSAKALVLE